MFGGARRVGPRGVDGFETALGKEVEYEFHARGIGKGQVIDLSLFEPMLSILGPQAANFKYTGKIKRRTGSRSTTTAPRNVYLTNDGKWVALSSASNGIVRRLLTTIGHPEMLDDPHFKARDAIVTVPHPDFGELRMQNVAPKLSETPGAIRRPSPAMGQHNEEVLTERLGMDAAEITRLQTAGVI